MQCNDFNKKNRIHEDENASENDESDEFALLTDQEIPLVVEQ